MKDTGLPHPAARRHFLGVDVGGTKTDVLIADGTGRAVALAQGGPGNWEAVGYAGLTRVLQDTVAQALQTAGLSMVEINGAGMGLAGYDWPSQRQAHLDAIEPLQLQAPLQVVNDTVLGLVAGSARGWGVSLVAGTGCNCRGWSRSQPRREGRVVGGAGPWSGEAAGAFDILARAMRAVVFQWTRRGPATALAAAFMQHTGAKDLDELIEGTYLGRFWLESSLAKLVFQVAAQGDPQALEVIRWAGSELGQMACGVIRQLDLEADEFDLVLVGSLYEGHPLLTESLRSTVQEVAPGARLVRLAVPPVVGAVLLGMEAAGLETQPVRLILMETTGAQLRTHGADQRKEAAR
jgi:N-acetylglucosamine kinase-like BadF-type ATPase